MQRALRLRAATLVAAFALAAGACGGGAGETGADSSEGTDAAVASGVELPLGLDRVPGGDQLPAAPPDSVPSEPTTTQVDATVELARPDIVVRPEAEGAAPLDTIESVKGIDHVAAASEFGATFVIPPEAVPAIGAESEAASPAPSGPREVEVTVLGIDPLAFRPLTPEVTAQEPGVWQRLLEGDVVVRHDVAQKLGLELGESYRLIGPAGEVEVRIGALASNGAPPLAEVLVPWAVANQLGAGDVNLLVLSAADEAQAEQVAEGVLAEFPGGEFELRSEPEEQRARLVGAGTHEFEPFNYTDLGDGMIVIDPSWVSRWIAPVDLPGLGTTRCHRIMIPQLVAALDEIRAAGLYGHFKPEQFGGCYMPRHIDWDPGKPLSMHAWGLAIDLNTHDNWLGQRPRMDPRVVEIFERWGFEWGGRWARPDGMHFELDRVINVSG